jgi:hypothetical protein
MANTAVPLKADFFDADVPGMLFLQVRTPRELSGVRRDQANHGSTRFIGV